MTANQEIAKTIIQQLGGNKFIAMTGAHTLFAIEKGVTFRLPYFPECRINFIRIRLNAMDTYDVDYIRVRGESHTIVKEDKGLYFDMLQSAFTEATGLNTSL